MRIPPPAGARTNNTISSSEGLGDSRSEPASAPEEVARSDSGRNSPIPASSGGAVQAALIAQLGPRNELSGSVAAAAVPQPVRRRTAAEEQAAIIAMLTQQHHVAEQNRPHSNLESFSGRWNDWAREATGPGENRAEAVSRMQRLPVRGISPRDQVFINLNRVTLDLRGLGLTSLPDLPETIQHLNLRDNGLTNLPANFPTSLERLDASHNPLTSVPDSLLALPRNCHVSISSGHLSEAVRNRLAAITGAPGYDGPTIHFDMSTGNTMPVRPLVDEINAWIAETPSLGDASSVENRVVPTGTNAADFSQFLGRLRETQDYRNPATQAHFQQRVRALIDHVQHPDHGDLRATCLAQGSEAVATCGDRVAFAFLDMETQCRVAQAERDVQTGQYDENPAELVKLGQGLFRLEQLQTIAREKVDTLHFVDPIEVHLGYLVQLSTQFGLPVQMQSMLYPRCTQLSDADVKQASQRLNTDENNNGLVAYLANFSPVDSYLQRAYPEEYAAMPTSIANQVAAKKSAIQEQLAALESGSPDYAEIANALMEKFNALEATTANEVKGALIRKLPGLPDVNMDTSDDVVANSLRAS